MENLPLELISNIVSFIVIIAIVVKIIKYKKRVAVIDALYELGEQKKLIQKDKEFISSNLEEYKIKLMKQEAFIKLMYPAFILIIGIFMIFFEFGQAMIHANIVVVTYIYLYIKKVHYKNYIDLLTNIKL